MQPAQVGGEPELLPEPVLDEGPHFSYAVQWFIFSTIALVGYPLVLRRSARNRGELEGPAMERELIGFRRARVTRASTEATLKSRAVLPISWASHTAGVRAGSRRWTRPDRATARTMTLRSHLRLVLAPLLAGIVSIGVVPASPAAADDPIVRAICFPVTEPVSYIDDFGAPRTGHLHEGNDLIASACTTSSRPPMA